MKISRLGEAPDYRFSLANERTFLAWIRTSLGFLAAGVGLDQLAPDFVNCWRCCCACLPVAWRFMVTCAGCAMKRQCV